MYRPKNPFVTPLKYQIPEYKYVTGVQTKVWPNIESCPVFFGSFKTYGGTEIESNGILVIEDTAVIETWYNPEITSVARIYLIDKDRYYEIIGTPEDIDERHQFMKMKVKRISGGA